MFAKLMFCCNNVKLHCILTHDNTVHLYFMFNAGSVYFVDDKGRCTQCFTAEGPVKFLLYSEGKDMIVVVTEGLILSQHRVAHDGTTSEVAKVRAPPPRK